jgi:D-alanyl-D-alanine carboxypeptidase
VQRLSYQYQNQLFEAEIQITGSVEEASKNVNPPGISEHQSGLCIDMHNLPAASTAFGGTKEADWLAENAHKFGYILRYPKNKVSVTKINYEPWHFRYVGRYHATKMYELDMCLEEYIEYINK